MSFVKSPESTDLVFGERLLLSLFVFCLCFAPFAVLLQFDFALNELLIFAGPIVDAPTFGAREFYELILGHERRLYLKTAVWSIISDKYCSRPKTW